ncbi:MAG: hypothetical protein AAGB35_09375 [Pseudomonadota bacterium]
MSEDKLNKKSSSNFWYQLGMGGIISWLIILLLLSWGVGNTFLNALKLLSAIT